MPARFGFTPKYASGIDLNRCAVVEPFAKSGMTIGKASRQTGVGIGTIRDSEREGLIPGPARRPSGCRDCEPGVVQRLHFIRQHRRENGLRPAAPGMRSKRGEARHTRNRLRPAKPCCDRGGRARQIRRSSRPPVNSQ